MTGDEIKEAVLTMNLADDRRHCQKKAHDGKGEKNDDPSQDI